MTYEGIARGDRPRYDVTLRFAHLNIIPFWVILNVFHNLSRYTRGLPFVWYDDKMCKSPIKDDYHHADQKLLEDRK